MRILFPTLFIAVPFLFGSAPPSIQIPRISEPPTLADFANMKPNSALAATMTRVSGFIQREPNDGQPASQNTVVYLGYDRKNLYAIFLAFDEEPDKIRARMAPREQVFQDDYVDIQIDTFNDRRRAYTFLATPLGIQWDALWREGNDFDSSYDALWRADAEMTPKGYMVRMVIPFTTLRFSPDENQTWSMIFNRTIPRLSEESFWPEYTNRIEGRLNQAATAEGISQVSPGRNIRINPYLFSRNIRILNRDRAAFDRDDFDPDGGVDAKFIIRDSFVVDLTANPDFSQVESDEPQVTVNQRFEVRFPERRPFFLENADFFQTPINLMFTRRIQDPRAGARITGKQGPWGLGLMVTDDEAAGQRLPLNDPDRGRAATIGVMRINRDISRQSTIGFLATHRDFAEDTNQTFAIDGRIKLNQNWVTRFQAAKSRLEQGDITQEGYSYTIAVDRSGRHLTMHNHFLRTDPDFVTRLGFLRGEQRPNSRNLHQFTRWLFRPEKSSLLSWGPGARIGRIWDLNNDTLDTFYNPQVGFEWASETELEIRFDYNRQRLTPSDFPQLAADRELTDASWEIEFETDYFAAFNFGVTYRQGKGINFDPAPGLPPATADLRSAQLEFTLRPISPLRIDGTYFWSQLHDRDQGSQIFDNTIWRVRGNWQFTRELSLRLISQWEDTDANPLLSSLERTRAWNNDLLLRYIINPWTGLYLGFNNNDSNFRLVETQGQTRVVRTDGSLENDGRQWFLKFSYLFQF